MEGHSLVSFVMNDEMIRTVVSYWFPTYKYQHFHTEERSEQDNDSTDKIDREVQCIQGILENANCLFPAHYF